MTCRECQDLSLEVARRRAAPVVAEQVRAHVSNCVRCASCLASQTALSEGLRALAASSQTASGAQLEQQLAARFAQMHGAPASAKGLAAARGVEGLVSRVLASSVWIAVAASVLLVAGIGAWWMATVKPGAAETATGPSLVQQAPNDERPVPRPPAVMVAPRVATPAAMGRDAKAGAPPEPVQPAGFVPLPIAAGLPDFESGEIVRLELPVTSLPGFGVEMPSAAGARSVQADLLIGQDGQPRAIRLVTASSNDPRPRR